MSTTLLRAKWVAPMDRPIIANGGVVIEGGRLVEVGEARGMRADRVEDFGDAVILPGLVNAHTHLELTDFACGESPNGFVDWLKRRVPNADLTMQQIVESVTRAISSAVAQCARFGVTSVGDISRHCRLTRELLRRSRLRVVSYGEVTAMGQRRGLLEQRLAEAVDPLQASERVAIGLTPHAPYSVEIGAYRRCLQAARDRNLPLATHLAETTDETTFLAEQTGAFRELWDAIGRFDEHVPGFAGGPIRFAKEVGLLDYPTLLAHVNYCDDGEMEILAKSQASVVYCPRTHAYFGHAPHRFRKMISRGINVAIGTDSCASSPDLNIVDDLRLVHRIAPEVPAETLWEMITTRGATAMQQQGQVGSLTPGKLADFVVFPASTDDPLNEILERDVLPSATSHTFASRD